MDLTRRQALRAMTVGTAAAFGALALGSASAGATVSDSPVAPPLDRPGPGRTPATADPDLVGGTLLDYSAGLPDPAAIAAAGHLGAIRYCSDPRAGWMAAKPIKAAEADALTAAGLIVVSCYQYGKDDTSDWHGGHPAGVEHARRALELHEAAGGPDTAPIYMSIDSDPTATEYRTQVSGFLRGAASVLGTERLGVYANAPTIDWALDDGLDVYFWQHKWGSDGRIHPKAALYQEEIDARKVDGIGVDVNRIMVADFGAW